MSKMLEEIKAIRKDIAEIKEYIVDSELNTDDLEALKDYEKEKKSGTLTSHEEVSE